MDSIAGLVDGLGYLLEGGICRVNYPSDGWLTGLTTLAILGCYALTRLTTPLMVG
jgi:hypothetical protein